MATKMSGCSRLYLKKSFQRSRRRHNRYRKKAVDPAKAGSRAGLYSETKD